MIPSSAGVCTDRVREILGWYGHESPGVCASLMRILMQGCVGGSGKLLILPIDQGFEHGPVRSFSRNVGAYDPMYHFKLAVEAGMSALVAPLGFLEVGARDYAGILPLILKVNSSCLLNGVEVAPSQAVTASVQDALRLGCVAVGYTIYPGSDDLFGMLEGLRSLISEAKECGLAVVVWSYPRGSGVSKNGEVALDIVAYAAHIACLMGANIVKVKLPEDRVESDSISGVDTCSVESRVRYVKQACFAGRRLVVFSGGKTKSDDMLLDEVTGIVSGGGDGSIIGRNVFQRDKCDALNILARIAGIYSSF